MLRPWVLGLALLLPRVAGGLGKAASPRDPGLLPSSLQPGVCHYGTKLACCYGWRRNSRGACEATCQPGCKFGDCVGPNQCRCLPGFTGKTCSQDVNECGMKPRPCQHRCVNTHGSYKCFCLSGHMLMPDATCANSRTCAGTSCQYGCEDTAEGPRCLCPSSGLRLSPNGRLCIDIDECSSSGKSVCPYNRRCVNTFGSYYCKCHVGFELTYINGRYDCIDLNECAVNTHQCSLHANCLNTQGSFKCRCKQGYKGNGLRCSVNFSDTVNHLPPSTVLKIPITGTFSCLHEKIAWGVQVQVRLLLVISENSVREFLRAPGPIKDRIKKLLAHKNSMRKKVKIKNVITSPAGTPAPHVNLQLVKAEESISRDGRPEGVKRGKEDRRQQRPEGEKRAEHALRKHEEQGRSLRGDVFAPEVKESGEFGLSLAPRKSVTSKLERKDLNISADCSFDQGICEWKQDNEDDFDWNPADRDNAVGYYMAVSALTGRRKDVGRLELLLHNLPPQDNFCLLFDYRLAGDKVGKLRVFVKNSNRAPMWEETRSEDESWKTGKIQLHLGTDTTNSIIFEAQRGKGRTGEIAVDGVLLISGLCPNGLVSVDG